MEAMTGIGEERSSRQRRDVTRGEELEDCSEGRMYIRLNFLLSYLHAIEEFELLRAM